MQIRNDRERVRCGQVRGNKDRACIGPAVGTVGVRRRQRHSTVPSGAAKTTVTDACSLTGGMPAVPCKPP